MVEDLAVALFVQHEGRQLDSVQWLRETIAEAKLHENATAQAMRAALGSCASNWRQHVQIGA